MKKWSLIILLMSIGFINQRVVGYFAYSEDDKIKFIIGLHLKPIELIPYPR